ncbi:MAG: hypothetical protein M1839_004504, partial [Geoglossum umbratile]
MAECGGDPARLLSNSGETKCLVKVIIGKVGLKGPGKVDGIKKHLRKQSKDDELHQLRHQLANYQSSLQVHL